MLHIWNSWSSCRGHFISVFFNWSNVELHSNDSEQTTDCYTSEWTQSRAESRWDCPVGPMMPSLPCCAITRLALWLMTRQSTGRLRLCRRCPTSLSSRSVVELCSLFVFKICLNAPQGAMNPKSFVPACKISPSYLLLVQLSLGSCSVIKVLFNDCRWESHLG